MKKTLVALFSVSVATAAFGQAPTTQRNFDRLDRIYHNKLAQKTYALVATAGSTDLHYWQAAASYAFPNGAQSYIGSVLYTDEPLALGKDPNGYKTFQSSTTFTHTNFSAGFEQDQWSELLSYQATRDKNGAISPGVSVSQTNHGEEVFAPEVSGTYEVGDFQLIPTATYDYINYSGYSQSGTVPDFMLVYQPSFLRALTASADYTVATVVGGPGSVQFAGKYALTKDGLTSVKFGATTGAGIKTAFVAQIVVKLF